jgi:YVTN family beta-propeller protein
VADCPESQWVSSIVSWSTVGATVTAPSPARRTGDVHQTLPRPPFPLPEVIDISVPFCAIWLHSPFGGSSNGDSANAEPRRVRVSIPCRRRICTGHLPCVKGVRSAVGSRCMLVVAVCMCVALNPVLSRGISCAYITDYGANAVALVDPERHHVSGMIPVGGFPIPIAALPDGSAVYVGNRGGGTISVIDTASQAVVTTIPVDLLPAGIAASPTGDRVYVTNSFVDGPIGNTVSVIDTESNTVIATVGRLQDPASVVVDRNGAFLYVANGIGPALVWRVDTEFQQPVIEIEDTYGALGLALTPDGRFLYVTGSHTGQGEPQLQIIDTERAMVVRSIPIETGFSLAFSPDGRTAYAGALTTGLIVIDTPSETVVDTVHDELNVREITVSPDGTLLYVTEFRSPFISVIDACDYSLVTSIGGLQEPTGAVFVNDVACPRCAGDCDLDRHVLVHELVTAVDIALSGLRGETCLAADEDGNEAVTLDELVSAVSHSLTGCSSQVCVSRRTRLKSRGVCRLAQT